MLLHLIDGVIFFISSKKDKYFYTVTLISIFLLSSFFKRSCHNASCREGRNDISKECATAISTLLANDHGSSLKFLYLDKNPLEDGVSMIAEALVNNTCLTALCLMGTNPDISSSKALARALESNSTLTYLSLGQNSTDHDLEVVEAFQKALSQNSTLETLVIAVSTENKAAVQKLKESRPTLTIIPSV
ncbi:hypothetical protein [Candidatus Odyssella thessalonicensis]|uniref:hypothetical protein n=1 Tax=Candidatus Odyssella thessalonicensis TaxID=84647 RepID=UPI000225AF2B|nr:hypothetical protein [Candidatus Odyssella thessalonicensis]